jgi:hypothetical protein
LEAVQGTIWLRGRQARGAVRCKDNLAHEGGIGKQESIADRRWPGRAMGRNGRGDMGRMRGLGVMGRGRKPGSRIQGERQLGNGVPGMGSGLQRPEIVAARTEGRAPPEKWGHPEDGCQWVNPRPGYRAVPWVSF